MTLYQWLLDKKVYVIIHGGLLLLLLIFLSVFGMNNQSLIFITLIMLSAHFSYLYYEYFRRYRFYKKADELLNGLEHKFLVHELMDQPHFFEGEFIYNLICDTNKSMNDEIFKYKHEHHEYTEYIETWVHEIKTPVAASELIIHNNQSEVTKSLQEEIKRIDDYVEQVLYYARSNHLEKDYIIKSCDLKEVVQTCLRKFSKILISKKCVIELDNLNVSVKSDDKWLVFILSQLIKNSIQYSTSPMFLNISTIEHDHHVLLKITDHGYGILKADLPRVFSKGFTGETGRKETKSTGIGLYLCQKLCKKMGLDITVESEIDQFTCVTINFPKSNMY